MRFPLTEEKLLRCERLLALLSSHQKDHGNFDALLDAVVDEGRTVTWVLQKELAEVAPGLAGWYEQERVRMSLPENSGLPWLKEVRNVSTKEGGVGVGTFGYFRHLEIKDMPPDKDWAITGRGEVVWINKDSQGREVATHNPDYDSEIESKHFIKSPPPPQPLMIDGVDLSGRDATAVLTAYLGYLRGLLGRAEAEASRSDPGQV